MSKTYLQRPSDTVPTFTERAVERLPYAPVKLSEFIDQPDLQRELPELAIPFEIYTMNDLATLHRADKPHELRGDSLAVAAFFLCNPSREIGAIHLRDLMMRRMDRDTDIVKRLDKAAGVARKIVESVIDIEPLGVPSQRRYRLSEDLNWKLAPLILSDKKAAPKISLPRQRAAAKENPDEEKSSAPKPLKARLIPSFAETRARRSHQIRIHGRTLTFRNIEEVDAVDLLQDGPMRRSELTRELGLKGNPETTEEFLGHLAQRLKAQGFELDISGKQVRLLHKGRS
jgi:hypothetical protein